MLTNGGGTPRNKENEPKKSAEFRLVIGGGTQI